MDDLLETTDTSLTLTRTFNATPEELWELWTDTVMIDQWHRPDNTNFTTKSESDTRVDGNYQIAMSHHGQTDIAHGKYLEVDRPHRLVYSWQWGGSMSSDVSEVSVTFDPAPKGTTLTLVHTRLSGPEAVKSHGEGWLGCMKNIESLIKTGV